ncbi:MAG: hypothetical protein RLO81_07725 [Fulvivirga sp.]|uniref:hypothetical protein n=1 Tax=Fulvivirga sp. TaxID=1931237 RepID=UPI0032EFCBA9
MELRDFIVTPIWLFIIYGFAYWVRPKFTDVNTKRYFIPALTVRIIGALAVGIIYQFYYNGGDTFNFHTHGSRHIWEAFINNPLDGLSLIFGYSTYNNELYSYSSKILFYSDPSSFFVIRMAGLFDILTFSSYSATAIMFAVISFIGLWAFFMTFYNEDKMRHKLLAFSVLFIPSVIFWGSGLLKDSITLGAVGLFVYSINELFNKRKGLFIHFMVLIITFLAIFIIKKYILICLVPSMFMWILLRNTSEIRSFVVKILVVPILFVAVTVLGYFAVDTIVEEDRRYSLDKIAETAQITAYDIGFYTGKNAGSGYTLGELDGSLESMFRLFPEAVNVTLFRPYLWEVSNPLMLISALESLILLFITGLIIMKVRPLNFIKYALKPIPFFCLIFSIVFAFAVGASTFNFGTLVRYKIPMLPFYLTALVFIYSNWKSDRNESLVASTE